MGDKVITLENGFPLLSRSLLSNNFVVVLQDIIQKRYKEDNGFSRKQTIQLIVDLGVAYSDNQAENHLDYLIRIVRLDKLKRNGRVVAAQATTTERSQINVAQQHRWRCLIESYWK